MKTLPVFLLAVLVAGCHFDKLFSASAGDAAARGSPAPPAATHLIFITEPRKAAPGSIITPPVRVAAVDDQNNVMPTFSGTITMAIGHNGGLLQSGTLRGTLSQPTVNGIATFADLSIDQPGLGYTLVASNVQPWSVASEPFDIGVP
jgi:hypothetical protein